MAERHLIRIGPAGWSYADWRGIVYPAPRPRGFHELEYLSDFFHAVEINTTFYHPPQPGVVKEWIRQVEGKDFEFTTKLWQRFTHERNANPEDETTFKNTLAPLIDAGRLGALLVQFPWSFANRPENRQYLTDLCRRFREYPLVLEVRHSSWNTPEVLEMLGELGVGFCNIDQPVIGRSIRPSEHITAPVGYVRLHGRNYQEWFSSRDDAGERYNYLYQLRELDPWVERIRRVASSSRVTFVITNNHPRGQAVANALQLVALVTGAKIHAPGSLVREYPVLGSIAEPSTESAAESAGQVELPFETFKP